MLRSSVLRGARGDGAQIVDHAGVWVQFLVLILREVIGLGVVTEDVFARVTGSAPARILISVDLPGAVDAHQRHAVAALDDQVAHRENTT